MANKQIILVTGASSGFGKITASLLAQQGHTVYGTSRKITAGTSEEVRMIKMDVTDAASIQEAITRIISEQGHIDVVVNNAGVGISGAIELATDEEIAWQMDTNFTGVTRVCCAILPYMRKAGKGKIINISSIGGVIAVPFQGFYSASKFAVEGYSEALANEVRPFGIQVCLVEPGDFNTNFTANRNISSATQEHPDYKETFARSMKIIEQAEDNGSDPQKLGRVICKLVEAKRPAFRTKVGPFDQVLFARVKGLLPDKLVHAAIRFFYKIK